MSQKSILITGCSTGIGLTCALGLHARGWRVFATARRSEDVEVLRSRGLESVRLDVTDGASIDAALAEIFARTGGKLDALFNNAGYGQPGAVEDVPTDALRAQFEANVFGPHELLRRVLPGMRAQGGGRIVVNSSLLGYVALPFRGAYNASKFALEGLYDTLRLELHGTGVHVSLIEPGPVTSRFRANAVAMFQRHINIEASPHRAHYEGVLRRLNKPGPAAPFTLAPEAVLAKLIRALESPRPRARYRVTVPAQFFWIMRRLLPTAALDRVLRMVGAGENR